MGKVIMSVVAACAAVVFLAGCGNPPSHWQRLEGVGYVNLDKVALFRSSSNLTIRDGKDSITLLDGDEITKENIKKALEKLEKHDVDKVIVMNGNIAFDGTVFPLSTKLEKDEEKDSKKKEKKNNEPEYTKYNKEEIKEVLENWLDIVKDVKSNLP